MVNSVSEDTFLDWFKMKAFADDGINVAKELTLGRIENIVGKGKISNNVFKRLFSQGRSMSGLSGKKLSLYQKTKFYTYEVREVFALPFP